MKKQFGEYQRLAKGVFSCSSLWQGEDHLLYVRGNGFLIPFSEEYLRFRYKDIQALVIVGTSGRWVSAILYALGTLLFAGLCALILSMGEGEDVGALVVTLLFPFPLTMVFLLLLVRTLLLGQRCKVEVQTSLKKERFRMLTRLPLARRVVESLDELIQESQKDLIVAGDTGQEFHESKERSEPSSGLSIPLSAAPAFAASAVMGAMMLVQLHVQSVVIAWVTQLMGLFLVPLLLVALAASVRRLTSDGIRFPLWGVLGSLLAVGGGGFIFLVNAAMVDPAVTVSPIVYIEAFSSVNRIDDLGFYLYFLIVALAILTLAVVGLLNVMLQKGVGKK
ncbi:MAG: hypothetical protein QM496_15100 [Verrucomicrobiota bacterium]